jgi:hypothetical protein
LNFNFKYLESHLIIKNMEAFYLSLYVIIGF